MFYKMMLLHLIKFNIILGNLTDVLSIIIVLDMYRLVFIITKAVGRPRWFIR